MAYSTYADIREAVDDTDISALTDDSDVGATDEDKVSRAIDDADAEIDAYCGVRYAVPFAPVPALVRKLSVDIAAYNLYARRGGAPQDRKDRYDNAVRVLQRISDGKISLGANDPDDTPSEASEPTISSSGRVFSRSEMEGW